MRSKADLASTKAGTSAATTGADAGEVKVADQVAIAVVTVAVGVVIVAVAITVDQEEADNFIVESYKDR